MFEIFLFVNPIGIYCYDTEILLKEAIDELNINSCFHFIPVTNAKVIKDDIIRRKKSGQRINDISQYTMASFQALRHYHAIKFKYGNKRARAFLVNLQQAISQNFNSYSPALPQEVANKLNLDYQKIIDPKISSYIEDSIQQDKELTQKFNVRNIPTTIIFNESGNYNGIMLEGTVAHDKLVTLFENTGCLMQEDSYYPTRHLRLI